jgi:uncharacterized protein
LTIYLDANVMVAAVLKEPFTARVKTLVNANPGELLTSDFAVAEAVSAISRSVRTRRLTRREGEAALSFMDKWMPTFATLTDFETADIRAATAILRTFDLGLKAPDAINVAIAQRHKAELATFDVRLAAAARKLGVQVAKL